MLLYFSDQFSKYFILSTERVDLDLDLLSSFSGYLPFHKIEIAMQSSFDRLMNQTSLQTELRTQILNIICISTNPLKLCYKSKTNKSVILNNSTKLKFYVSLVYGCCQLMSAAVINVHLIPKTFVFYPSPCFLGLGLR